MKTALWKKKCSLFVMAVSLFLCSCVSIPKFGNDQRASRDESRRNFIEMKDGKVYEVDEVIFRNPLFKRSTVEISETERVETRDVIAYQDRSGYYRRVEGQFAPRIKKGLINLYQTMEITQDIANVGSGGSGRVRTRMQYHYYLQKGDNAPVEPFSAKLLMEYVKDYPPSMKHISEYQRKRRSVRRWSWINTGSVVGGAVLVASGVASMENGGNAKGYVGLSLMGGGIVSGLVNKVRKFVIHKDLEVALDDYNRQVKRAGNG